MIASFCGRSLDFGVHFSRIIVLASPRTWFSAFLPRPSRWNRHRPNLKLRTQMQAVSVRHTASSPNCQLRLHQSSGSGSFAPRVSDGFCFKSSGAGGPPPLDQCWLRLKSEIAAVFRAVPPTFMRPPSFDHIYDGALGRGLSPKDLLTINRPPRVSRCWPAAVLFCPLSFMFKPLRFTHH
jgi:hypothetical protein